METIQENHSLNTKLINTQKRKYLSYNECKEYARKLNIKTVTRLFKYWKEHGRPDNIPSNLNMFYKNNGWISFGDFFGTGNINNKDRKYLSYEECKEYAKKMDIKSSIKWKKYCRENKKIGNIPSEPSRKYKNNGWKCWGDFLGTGRININNKDRKYLSYEECIKFAQESNIKSASEWRKYYKEKKLPDNFPNSPDVVFKNKGWKCWGEFLGTGRIMTKNISPIEECKRIARELNIKSSSEWRKCFKERKLPDNIPSSPDVVFKNKGWKGWGEFLGTGRKRRTMK